MPPSSHQVCGVCIAIAWSISFLNWLLKRYRRHKLKQARLRRRTQVSGTSTAYRDSQRVRRNRERPRVGASAAMSSASDLPSRNYENDEAESTTSERINRLVREVSKDSENPNVNRNNLTGAPQHPSRDHDTPTLSRNDTGNTGATEYHSYATTPTTAEGMGFAGHQQQQPTYNPREGKTVPPPVVPLQTHSHRRSKESERIGEAYQLSPISAGSAPDAKTRHVVDELEDIDVHGV